MWQIGRRTDVVTLIRMCSPKTHCNRYLPKNEVPKRKSRVRGNTGHYFAEHPSNILCKCSVICKNNSPGKPWIDFREVLIQQLGINLPSHQHNVGWPLTKVKYTQGPGRTD